MKRIFPVLLAALFLCGCASSTAETTVPSTAAPETVVPTTAAPTEMTVPPTETEPSLPPEEGDVNMNTFDITFRVEGDAWGVYSGTMPKEYVTFVSDDPSIATFEDGVVTAIGPGTTNIHAIHGSDRVSCIIRNVFKASGKKEETPAKPTEEATPAETEPHTVDTIAPFFDDAVFVGDSVTLFLSYYAISYQQLGEAQFLVRGSYSVAHAVNSTMLMSIGTGEMELEDAIASTGATKVFIMLGMNDIALHGIAKTMENWKAMTDRILERNPDVHIIIQSMTPIYATGEKGGLTNENVRKYNTELEAFAQENGFLYLDVASCLEDEDGSLAPEFCSDEYVHLSDEGAREWIKVLRRFAYAHMTP